MIELYLKNQYYVLKQIFDMNCLQVQKQYKSAMGAKEIIGNGNNITIKIIDMNLKQHSVEVSKQITGQQLKLYIFRSLCKQLKIQQMKLTFEGKQLSGDTTLEQFMVDLGKMLVLKQSKIDLSQIGDLKIQNIEDPVFFQEYTYKWPCGHYIGQMGMNQHIKAIIAKHQTVIKCPYQIENGQICNYQWDYAICKKIGVFTQKQRKYFENSFNQNYLKLNQNIKKCPKCNQILLNQSNSLRIRCPQPKCKYDDFCYRCLQPWLDKESTKICRSQTCKFANEYLLSAPWDRKFQVVNPQTEENMIVMTPIYRACPTCGMVVQNYKSCKHTQCTICKKKFCWICLGVYKNKWECGEYGDYCGKVAPVQEYKIITK